MSETFHKLRQAKQLIYLFTFNQVMRTNLEPIIDTLFEEDELFAQDFDQDGLNRILFIRKMGIYVEVRFLHVSYSPPSSNPWSVLCRGRLGYSERRKNVKNGDLTVMF